MNLQATMQTGAVYLYHEKVLIPYMARTDAGMYLESEPVTVLNAGDREGIIRTLVSLASQPHVNVPAPAWKGYKPVQLKYAKVGSWSKFMKTVTKSWHLTNTGRGFASLPFQVLKSGAILYGNYDDHTIPSFPMEVLAADIADSIAQIVAQNNAPALQA